MPVVDASRLSIEPGSVIPGTRYRALRQIGASGGSVVYEVEHLGLGRRFALRVLRADLARQAEVVRRARAEWQALARLHHPHIARVTDAGVTATGTPYAVTEQARGETLRQRLTRRRSLSVPEALGIARELASALAAAHAIGVLHGDVALEHVFVTSDGGSKLGDFGNYESRSGGGPPALHADAYGLGQLLFEMVAGRPAFGGARTRRAARVRHALGSARTEQGAGRPPRLAEVVPGVAAALSELVARLLAPEPSQRPTLATVIAELGRLQCRYERQVSTTQETAHYVTRRLPFLVDTPPLPSDLGVIVPLPSQTLEGIPWTVFTPESVAHPVPSPATDAPLAAPPPGTPALSPPPANPAPRCLPRTAPPRGLVVRLLFVIACSLLAGFLVACVLRRTAADGSRAAPTQCSVRPERYTLFFRP